MALDWKGDPRTATLRLPTTRSGPRPSPGLIHTWELDEDTPPFLAPWLVSGLWLSHADAWHLLLELPSLGESREDGQLPFTLGDDTRFWHHAATLALETLTAQKLVPILAPAGPETYHARWLPVLDGPKDGPRLARLEAAMPPLCRAALLPSPIGRGAGGEGAEVSPRALLTSFLNTVCDALARRWGRLHAPRFTRSETDPAYRWLTALFNEEPTVKTSPVQMQSLAASHRAWMRFLHVAGDAAFRIAFRLEAPTEKPDWQLHYLLQARDDPSLIVPAEKAWQKTGGVLTELPVPPSLHAQLRPHQQYGFSWLEFHRRFGLGACLADDMGLGKTIQTLTLLLHEKETRGLPAPTLLICPTSVVTNWARESARFAPSLTVHVHQGPNRMRGEDFHAAAREADLVLTSYALTRLDAALLQTVDWLGVVLDEAQNIKNPTTKQTQAIRQLKAGFRFALTGTPVENRLSELWSIMHFLNPGYLGPRQHFRTHFALPIERYQDEDALHRLKQLTTPFILRRVKTDPTVIQDLPEKVETKVYCPLTEEQATLYEAIVQEAMQKIEAQDEGIERRGMVLSMLMQLKQICNHSLQYLHQANTETGSTLPGRSGKLERLVELLEEVLATGDRALIFTQFSEMGELLAGFLPQAVGAATQFLHGGTPAKQRDLMVHRFQEEAHAPPIFILSLKAGGTGLNLTRANHVFHFDRWWNPAVEDQATHRAFRIGQKQNVQVHKFVTTGTLEEMIDEMIESKKGLAQAVVGGGEGWLTELSTAELRELVKLRIP